MYAGMLFRYVSTYYRNVIPVYINVLPECYSGMSQRITGIAFRCTVYSARVGSPDCTRQHLLPFYKPFQHITYLHGAYACGRARVHIVPVVQREVARQVDDERIERKNQVAGVTILHDFSILFELKMNVCCVF